MQNLSYVPEQECQRILSLEISEAARIELFATACRINCLYMIARAGSGHIGTSFSSMDIMATLQLAVLKGVEDTVISTTDLFFSSKGHDVPARYAILLGCGLLDFDLIHQLRKLDGLPGHPDISVPYSYTNTGSLGMGISKARGMALARRQLGQKGEIFVLTGDGELQEGQFWESLQPTANQCLSEITVIVDHNKMQSDTWVDHVSSLGELMRKIAAFGWHVDRCNGHDVSQMLRCLRAPSPNKPRLIIADTIKGKGVSFMESNAWKPPQDRLYGFHSGAPTLQDYERALSELQNHANVLLAEQKLRPLQLEATPRKINAAMANQEKLIPAYGQALVEMAETNDNVVALDADLIKDTGLLLFAERFPDRFYECGIAEQDMVSQAGGMALAGCLPVVHSFACFLSSRPNEQIYNNASEHKKIIYVGSLAGVLPAGPGHSHQAVRDIASLSGIPNLTMLEPCNEVETKAAVKYAIADCSESVYLRLTSIPCSVPFTLPANYQLKYGQGTILRQGNDIALFAYGPVLLHEAYHAAKSLADYGFEVRLINMPWLNRVDRQWLARSIDGCSAVVTIDNHYIAGGQGQFLLAEMARGGMMQNRRCLSLGLTEFPKCGRNDEVLAAHKLDAKSIAEQILDCLPGYHTRLSAKVELRS